MAPNAITISAGTRPGVPAGIARLDAPSANVVRATREPSALSSPTAIPRKSSAASSYVCPVDDAAEPFVVGAVGAPRGMPTEHAGLPMGTAWSGAPSHKDRGPPGQPAGPGERA